MISDLTGFNLLFCREDIVCLVNGSLFCFCLAPLPAQGCHLSNFAVHNDHKPRRG